MDIKNKPSGVALFSSIFSVLISLLFLVAVAFATINIFTDISFFNNLIPYKDLGSWGIWKKIIAGAIIGIADILGILGVSIGTMYILSGKYKEPWTALSFIFGLIVGGFIILTYNPVPEMVNPYTGMTISEMKKYEAKQLKQKNLAQKKALKQQAQLEKQRQQSAQNGIQGQQPNYNNFNNQQFPTQQFDMMNQNNQTQDLNQMMGNNQQFGNLGQTQTMQYTMEKNFNGVNNPQIPNNQNYNQNLNQSQQQIPNQAPYNPNNINQNNYNQNGNQMYSNGQYNPTNQNFSNNELNSVNDFNYNNNNGNISN
ncbi:MAG: hypothetical protein HRS57_01255 [Mycoplasmataceae bacterium]|nr:hypothetical protein [Mycoplasmataceae bacterium]